MKALLWMVACAMLTACANTSSRYYSLASTEQRDQSASSQAEDAGFAFRLLEVGVPEQVDRPQLVVRGGSGPAVTVLNQSLWVAPLTNEIRAALAQELARILAAPDVSLMAAPSDLPVWTVAVQVRRFELMAGAWTLLDASWTLEDALASDASQGASSQRGSAAQICRAVIRMPVDEEGVEPLVDRQRTAVMRLAEVIAESISARRTAASMQSGSDKGCTYS